MNFLAKELQQRVALRPTVTKGEGIDVAKLLASEMPTTNEESTREYFFQSGVDEWYNSLEGFTFPSKFVELSREVSHLDASILADSLIQRLTCLEHLQEAIEIIRTYEANIHNVGKLPIPASLAPLCERMQECMNTFHEVTHYFVKLSTRSPKDSRSLFQRAGESYVSKMKEKSGNH